MPFLFAFGAVALVAFAIMSSVRTNNFLAAKAGEPLPAKPDEVRFWTTVTVVSGATFVALLIINIH